MLPLNNSFHVNSSTLLAHASGPQNELVSMVYGTRKSPQLDKPGFSQINQLFLQINLVYLKKPHFSAEKPGLSEIMACENHHN